MKISQNNTDEDLMIAYAKGQEDGFAILYTRHQGKVYSYLKKRLKNQTDVNEVFQLIFLKLHQTREQYSPQYLFLQWLFTISRSTVIDYCRKNNMKISQEKGVDEVYTDKYHHFEDLEHYTSVISRALNPIQKTIVTMKVFDEDSYEEISSKLNLTQENVRQVLSRSLRKLKDSFGKGER